MGTPYADPAAAAAYDRIAVPWQFAPPARDLVEMVDLDAARSLLDVGTGTGAVALAALERAADGTLIIGVDASSTMLRVARAQRPRHRHIEAIVGRAPGLPFRDATFDIVTSSFVVSHIRAYPEALADFARVCRAGGRVGITSWAPTSGPVAGVWSRVAATYVPRHHLDQDFRAVVPWEEWFSVPGNLANALRDAGLTAVRVSDRQYTIRMPTNEYLAMKEAGVESAIVRARAGPDRWNQFRDDVARACHERFGEVVELTCGAYFGIGTKPRD